MRCECGFIVIGDFTIIKVHLFRPVYVLIVYYYSTCNNNNNSAFILISVFFILYFFNDYYYYYLKKIKKEKMYRTLKLFSFSLVLVTLII